MQFNGHRQRAKRHKRQYSQTMIYKTQYRYPRTEQRETHKNWGELRCSERVSTTCSTIFGIDKIYCHAFDCRFKYDPGIFKVRVIHVSQVIIDKPTTEDMYIKTCCFNIIVQTRS